MRPLFKPNLRPNLGPTPINSLGPSRPVTKLSGQTGQPSINRRPSTTMAQQRASPPSISSLTRGPPCSRWSPSSREAYANAQHVMAIIKPHSCTNSSCLRPYPAHQSLRPSSHLHVPFTVESPHGLPYCSALPGMLLARPSHPLFLANQQPFSFPPRTTSTCIAFPLHDPTTSCHLYGARTPVP